MSEFDDDNDQTGEDAVAEPTAQEKADKGWRTRLEKKAKRADELERENAFLKAKVDVDDPKAKWFYKGYDGELTKDAITAAATEAGLIAAPAEAEDAIPAEEIAQHQRAVDLTTGARSTGTHDFDAQIAEARAAGQMQRVIQLKQAQSAAAQAR